MALTKEKLELIERLDRTHSNVCVAIALIGFACVFALAGLSVAFIWGAALAAKIIGTFLVVSVAICTVLFFTALSIGMKIEEARK